jgi:hypothetical protein
MCVRDQPFTACLIVLPFSATLNDAFGGNVLLEISQAIIGLGEGTAHRKLKLKSGGEFRMPEPIGLGKFD